MSLNLSLRDKIFYIFISVVIVSVSLVAWYGFTSSSKAYTNSAYELSKQQTASINLEIKGILSTVPKDVLYIKDYHALKRFMIWDSMNEKRKTKEWKQVLSSTLVDFMEKKQNYLKIRIIDLAGDEIVSVKYDRNKHKASLEKFSVLQNKKGRDYVSLPKKLAKDKFYVSQMNLNIENGVIETPHVPVVRYSTPIINTNGELIGVLIANIYAEVVLEILEKASVKYKEDGVSFFLVDNNGDYLYNQDKSKRWKDQLQHGFSFNKEHFNVDEQFKGEKSGAFEKNGKIYSFHKVHSLKTRETKNYWYAVSVIESSVALKELENFKLVFASILLIILIVSFLIVRFYIDRIITPLAQVTGQLNALAKGEIKKENIVYSSNDEIGQIVKSTTILVDAIETTILQANAVANGDFTKDIELLSKNDKLGSAIKDMTLRLKEITALSTSLSLGNYDVNIVAKSSNDKLGLALINMVEYLKVITEVTESIALGNLDVKYKAKGEDDRLGYAILQMIKYLKTVLKQANAIAKEDFSSSIEVKSSHDELGLALVTMTTMLRDSSSKNKEEIFFSDGVGDFSDKLTGINDTNELAKEAITIACRYIKASSGVLYTYNKDKKELNLIASFAYVSRDSLFNTVKLSEGVIGQVALEKEPILLRNIKDGEFETQSGTTLAKAKEVYTFPLMHEDELFGVAEIMSFESFNDVEIDYLKKISSIFAAAIHTSIQNAQIKVLLEKSQEAFEELQTQSEELQESNVQMEEQQQQLTLQSKELQGKNDTLAHAKEEIDQRAEDLEKASKYKSEFLANMSHELRTPLNSIILLSKLLTQNQNDTLNKKDVEKSAVIHKAGNDLLLLINDILDLSKVESGNMELIYEDVETSKLVDELQGLFGAVAEDKNLSFIVEDDFNEVFSTDITKLLQVLKNLLSNAFKFTKEGSVKLSIEESSSNIVFVVKDSGIGIPEDKLETIFEAFKQVDGTISREFGGTGLGLSISKTIVNLMNGQISVVSEFGKSTSFIVTLPLTKGEVSKLSQKAEVLQSQPRVKKVETISLLQEESEDISYEKILNGKNILIVDDDSRNIFTLTSTLESMDAEVYSAFNGKEAIEILADEEDIDLILMDIMMPVMDGLTAIKTIKADDKYKDIPIIVITAKTMPEDKQKCLDIGADDYLSKPVQHGALVSMLKAWIK